MTEHDSPADLVGDDRVAWRRFVERTTPARAELFRYCRSLTGSVWDAEDLAQAAMLRSFARLSEPEEPVANARAFLFRVASNLWIDQHRRSHDVALEPGIRMVTWTRRRRPMSAAPRVSCFSSFRRRNGRPCC